MPLTPEQIAKIRQKEAAISDALKRNPNVNYYEGWFFITLNTRDEVPVLSIVSGHSEAAAGSSEAPHCIYTQVGKGVLNAWKTMPAIHKFVETDVCEVMPEHFHGLLRLLPGNKRHLGSILSGFMGACTHAYWDSLGIDWHKDRYDQGAGALKIDRDRDHTHSLRGPSLFVRGYNDMEPVTPAEVEVKRNYIRDQARKRLIQGDNHQCFHKYRQQHSRSWTMERVMTAISTDRTFCHDPQMCQKAQLNVQARLNTDDKGIALDYIGNKQLLFSNKKLPLVCHRSDAAFFEKQKTAVLEAARNGYTIVSAFISQRERYIKQQLIAEQMPFIEIIDNGISDKYKGVGKEFYALAENRLCQITPWNYQYQKDTTITREMCLVMNELARVIADRPDSWWK